jgi:hypothetical protein
MGFRRLVVDDPSRGIVGAPIIAVGALAFHVHLLA